MILYRCWPSILIPCSCSLSIALDFFGSKKYVLLLLQYISWSLLPCFMNNSTHLPPAGVEMPPILWLWPLTLNSPAIGNPVFLILFQSYRFLWDFLPLFYTSEPVGQIDAISPQQLVLLSQLQCVILAPVLISSCTDDQHPICLPNICNTWTPLWVTDVQERLDLIGPSLFTIYYHTDNN